MKRVKLKSGFKLLTVYYNTKDTSCLQIFLDSGDMLHYTFLCLLDCNKNLMGIMG